MMQKYYSHEEQGRKLDRMWRDTLESAINDTPTEFLKKGLNELNDLGKKYASGSVNKRRELLKADIAERKQKLMHEYHESRRFMAQTRLQEAADIMAERKAAKRPEASRLALEEARLRYESMNDSALESQAGKPLAVNRDKDGNALMMFRDHYDYQSMRAELRKRGKGDLADDLEKRYAELPKDGFGDMEVAEKIADARHYGKKLDPDTVLVVNEQMQPIGIDVNELIEVDLSAVPE